jgi:hypothetical protein
LVKSDVPYSGLKVIVSGCGGVMKSKLKLYGDKNPDVRLFFCNNPEPFSQGDVFVIPDSAASGFLTGGPSAPVICYGSPENIGICLSAGCSDYLCEPWTPAELFSRVRRSSAFRTVSVQGCSLRCTGRKLMLTPPGPGSGSCPEVELSASEAAIFRALLRNRGCYVDRETLSAIISSRGGAGSRSVDMHVSRLRKKLHGLLAGVSTEPVPVIRNASGRGWGIIIPPKFELMSSGLPII